MNETVEKMCPQCRSKTNHDKDGTCLQCVARNQWVGSSMAWCGEWLEPYSEREEGKNGKRIIRIN